MAPVLESWEWGLKSKLSWLRPFLETICVSIQIQVENCVPLLRFAKHLTCRKGLPLQSWSSALEGAALHLVSQTSLADAAACEKSGVQRAFDAEDFKLSLITETFFLSPLHPQHILQEIIASGMQLGCKIAILKEIH